MVVCAAGLTLVGCAPGTEGTTSTAPILTTTTPSTAPTTTESTTSRPDASTSTTTVPTTTTTTVAIEDLELVLTPVADGFDGPVLLVADPDGGADLVVEQTGRIVRRDAGRTPVLDIRSDVVAGGEQGLLGLAYHPDFAENRLAYVNYTGRGGQTVIEQFRVAGSGTFDPASRTVILEIAQPAGNHNGGMIAFGPEGYLWIGMGDGGGSDDRFGNGQRPDTLLGAMLRIAVGIDDVATYAIPPDNPYVNDDDGANEVWAIGLRNPWRFSFDGDVVWIGDVGQGTIEEVSRAPAGASGLNYGWPIMEGSTCFQSATCDESMLEIPVTEYDHGDGCSVTGGYVYRGDLIPELTGEYFYSDYCSGFLRSYSDARGDTDWTPMVGTTPNVSSFGVGGDGELYVISRSGAIYRLERAA